ncbi:exosome complex component RRP40 isoform X1 [Neodiprion lecontei]|uniref:Exosome complex component RRP40 n=1 Tax=Neodiprion lecontei TaxID=441921 RepID=A0A6J0B818_NEOLC|nr:exosome complex component RRP40 isoform X1 [Neodiprion lecontei]XP_046598035.1 exosome complex component RRP40 isoform X1 [Neodiprion lecontei]XP_046598036.1 exosome complex component RRP40 isoform X1 [Neodiprion lecontei]
MEVNIKDVVVPGDVAVEIMKSSEKERVILGPGLRRDCDRVLVTKAGVLKRRKPAIFYVDSYQKRYVPNRGENVVGIVTQKAGDIYRVDIGAGELASLSYLAFEGATKKNRPDIVVGDVIFAKLLVASKGMEPELICVDSHGKKGKLGVLSPDGMLFDCSLSLARKLLHPSCQLLTLLAKEQAYEIAIGMNGKIWMKARSVHETIAACNAILAAENTPPAEMPALCSSIARNLLRIS